MEYSLKIGKTEQSFHIPEENVIGILYPDFSKVQFPQTDPIEYCLNHPIGSSSLDSYVDGSTTVSIIVSDISRPLPSYAILPTLIKHLLQNGVRLSNITVVFATGIHRKHTESEMISLVGQEVYFSVKCIDSSADRCVRLGYTSHGTPIDIDSVVIDSDLRICVGNVEFHYFAGFSGGVKAIFPGCSSHDAIQHNHKFMLDPTSYVGSIKDNKVRLDLEESLAFLKTTLILNVVLDTEKRINYAVFGDPIEAHRVACKYLQDRYTVPIHKKADIVIVSQGGHPKDANLYQTQKALDNAKFAVKDGGTIILVGSCSEGFGEKVFEEWMLSYNEPDAMIEKLKKGFLLGAHKAVAIAKVRKKCKIILVSNMERSVVEKTIMEPADTIETAFVSCFKQSSSVFIIPSGGSTVPILID